MLLPVILQLIFYFLNNGAHGLSSNSDTHSAKNFTFKNSADYLTTMHYLEARMTAFIKLADVESNSQEISINWKTKEPVFEENLEKKIYNEWKLKFGRVQRKVLMDQIMQLGKELREEINGFQMGWSVPAVALTTKLEGKDVGRTVLRANGAFDKVRLKFEKQLVKMIAVTDEKLPFPPSDPISTPQGYYTEVVNSYNLASSLLQLLNDIRKQANKDNSSTTSTRDVIYEPSCELGIGVPLPTSQQIQDMIEKRAKHLKMDYEKVFKFGAKLVEMLRLLEEKKSEMIEMARENGMSSLAELIEDAWTKYESCKIYDEKTLKQNMEILYLRKEQVEKNATISIFSRVLMSFSLNFLYVIPIFSSFSSFRLIIDLCSLFSS
ncbi:hypothetical protein DdX_13224 [Ditylenchus destructor]|uniref:Uncharacterized protein n=1 Tax=Ditylenchus destructor TaxID=166010 RepID=A0AAD4MT50_9BILA|nr:hypothetical protein DdX_13224 [Ditylenchus destructor]